MEVLNDLKDYVGKGFEKVGELIAEQGRKHQKQITELSEQNEIIIGQNKNLNKRMDTIDESLGSIQAMMGIAVIKEATVSAKSASECFNRESEDITIDEQKDILDMLIPEIENRGIIFNNLLKNSTGASCENIQSKYHTRAIELHNDLSAGYLDNICSVTVIARMYNVHTQLANNFVKERIIQLIDQTNAERAELIDMGLFAATREYTSKTPLRYLKEELEINKLNRKYEFNRKTFDMAYRFCSSSAHLGLIKSRINNLREQTNA